MQSYRKRNTVRYIVVALLICGIFYLNNHKFRKVVLNTSNSDETIVAPILPAAPKLDTKYILLWTSPLNFPFIYFGNGKKVFIERKCKYQNCFVTSDRSYSGLHYSEFDVIAFNGPQLGDLIGRNDIPLVRSGRQKYVYANIEAAVYYPICNNIWDNFFNWTWTYRLNSDAVWGYILIKNASNHVIGPSVNMDWIGKDNMTSIGDDIKAKLANKTMAAAWFVSNCRTLSKREMFVNAIQAYIGEYNLKVDVYGDCGDFQCPKSIMKRCLASLQRNYYFYFAFENALSEDYVTEKILHALNHYTVPVVYGGANYSRFLPPGSYLDALALGPQVLARKIHESIENPAIYYEFFKWRRYYSYHLRHESPDTDDYCKFCTMVNDDALMNKSSTYTNFSTWWSPKSSCSGREPNKLSFHTIIS